MFLSDLSTKIIKTALAVDSGGITIIKSRRYRE